MIKTIDSAVTWSQKDQLELTRIACFHVSNEEQVRFSLDELGHGRSQRFRFKVTMNTRSSTHEGMYRTSSHNIEENVVME